jgi:hypothetical protein
MQERGVPAEKVAEAMDIMRFFYNGYSWDGGQRLYVPFPTLVFFELQTFKNHYSENRVSREDAKAQRKAIFIVGCASQRHGRLLL